MRYSFGPLIQSQLHDLVVEWNYHYIRKRATAECPGGVYHLPNSCGQIIIIIIIIIFYKTGATNNLCSVDDSLLRQAMEEYRYSNDLMVDEAYKEYADTVCEEFNLPYPPTSHEDALLLFFFVLTDEQVN